MSDKDKLYVTYEDWVRFNFERRVTPGLTREYLEFNSELRYRILERVLRSSVEPIDWKDSGVLVGSFLRYVGHKEESRP